MQVSPKPRIIVILGPTASGKSDLAVQLAKKFNGEIISADSRQVYRGLDIGTGKVTRDTSGLRHPERAKRVEGSRIKSRSLDKLEVTPPGETYFHKGVRHHLLDVANPKKQFTVVDYQKLGKKAIRNITERSKIPIICGGTGLYVDALLYDIQLPSSPINTVLRKKLERLETEKLFILLQKKDPHRAKAIDRNNRRRIIRALEIINTKKIVSQLNAPIFSEYVKGGQWQSPHNTLIIGIRCEPNDLRKRIDLRLKKRLPGIIREIKKLRASGISWKRLENFGLEYRWGALFLQKKLPRYAYKNSALSRIRIPGFSPADTDALYSILRAKIWRYAKRQLTWFKRNPNIIWVPNEKRALRLARQYMKKI